MKKLTIFSSLFLLVFSLTIGITVGLTGEAQAIPCQGMCIYSIFPECRPDTPPECEQHMAGPNGLYSPWECTAGYGWCPEQRIGCCDYMPPK